MSWEHMGEFIYGLLPFNTVVKNLKVQVSEYIERKFRELAMRRFGYGKGSLSKAAEEAFAMWISIVEGSLGFNGDPVEAIEGLLAHIKIDSLKLQHEVINLWASRVVEDVPE